MKWFKFNDYKDTVVDLESVECIQTNMTNDGSIYQIIIGTKSGSTYIAIYSRSFESDFTSDFVRLYDMFK